MLSPTHSPVQRAPVQRGLTVIELLAALAILAISLTLASSGLRQLRSNLHMSTRINGLAHAVHSARQQALSQGIDIVICPTRSGEHCEATARWHDGWLTFINSDQDSPPSVDANERILHTAPATPTLQISANRAAFVLRPFGLRSTNGTVVFCDRHGLVAARALIVSYTGKPRASRTLAGGATPRCGAG